jgi:hypothetical protein
MQHRKCKGRAADRRHRSRSGPLAIPKQDHGGRPSRLKLARLTQFVKEVYAHPIHCHPRLRSSHRGMPLLMCTVARQGACAVSVPAWSGSGPQRNADGKSVPEAGFHPPPWQAGRSTMLQWHGQNPMHQQSRVRCREHVPRPGSISPGTGRCPEGKPADQSVQATVPPPLMQTRRGRTPCT